MTAGGGAGAESGPVYDRIGRGYRTHRVADLRWQAAIDDALGDAATVLNVGAGTGSYEPTGRATIGVEPSTEMLDQRPVGAAPALRGVAEALPIADGAVDAALAVLTTHHWTDASAGFSELSRVSGRQVVVTWDPVVTARFWLVADYLPEIAAHEAGLATMTAARAGLPGAIVSSLPVPADFADGVLGAYWARPDAYLDAGVRAGISSLSLLPAPVVARAVARLTDDLTTGAWHHRHGPLLAEREVDLGYRLLVAEQPGPRSRRAG